MWVLLPVKRLEHSKLRLAGILTPAQRRQLSHCMVEDILSALDKAAVISGVTVISCDETIISLAQDYRTDVLNTGADHGYSSDVLKGIEAIRDKTVDNVLIIPADLPEIDDTDLIHLDQVHGAGITLCPAEKDGGTNGLVFTPPLAIDLKYGENSFERFRKEAQQQQVTVNVANSPGLARDIDRPDDLLALQQLSTGGHAWRYLNSLKIPSGATVEETAYLMASPENAGRLNDAISEVRAGKTVQHELIEE